MRNSELQARHLLYAHDLARGSIGSGTSSRNAPKSRREQAGQCSSRSTSPSDQTPASGRILSVSTHSAYRSALLVGEARAARYDEHGEFDQTAVGNRVGVVIVNYNGGDVVLRALARLREQTTPAARVVVVDNASSDGSDGQGRPGASVGGARRRRHEHGFAGGNNIGMKMLTDCDWIALLNPDAFPEPTWLEALLDARRRQPAYSFFASLLLNDADPDAIDGAGDAYHPSGLAWRLSHARKTR